MPILRSPGCNCSCECLLIEETDYNTSITANTEHEIPHTIPINCAVDLSNLLPEKYFEDDTNIFKIHIKDSSGTTTHKTLTYQSVRDTTAIADPKPITPPLSPGYDSPVDVRYSKATYKRYLQLNDEDYDFESFIQEKSLYVGEKLFRIKSVSAGTYDDSEGVAASLKGSFGSDLPETQCQEEYKISQFWSLQKNRYAFPDDSTSQVIKTIRYDRTDKCENEVETRVRLFYSGGITEASQGYWPNGTQVKSATFGVTLTANEEAAASLRHIKDLACPYETGLIVGDCEVFAIPTATETGDGHFELETTVVRGEEGSSTDVRVYRTGGNSTAVDVVVANGNSDVTLNFAAGDVYKDFTITHDSHNGSTFTSGMVPTNDLIRDFDLRPMNMVFRKNTFEYGHPENFLRSIKNSGGKEWWWPMIASERDTWANSSIKVYVESNVDVTLEEYKVFEIKHEANCSLVEDNADCPEYVRCDVIPEYHAQQFDLSVDFGLASQYMPDLAYSLNEHCSSEFRFWNEPLPFEGNGRKYGTGIAYGNAAHWAIPFNILDLDIRSSERTVNCYDDAYWDAQETSTNITISCGTFVSSTDFSQMPRSCAAFGSIDYCFTYTCGDAYTNGTEDGVAYPVGDLPDYEPIYEGRYVTSCHEIVECQSAGYNTNDSIHVISVKAVATKASRVGYLTDTPFDEPAASNLFRAGHRQESYDAQTNYWQNFWQHDGTSWGYVGQGKVHEVFTSDSVATVKANIDFLQSGGADYWFEYTHDTDATNDGFYRVRYPQTITGPFTSADDGSGNVFASVSDDVGIYANLSVDYFRSLLNQPAGTDLDSSVTNLIDDLQPGYTVVDGDISASFEGTFKLNTSYFDSEFTGDWELPMKDSNSGFNLFTEIQRIDGLVPLEFWNTDYTGGYATPTGPSDQVNFTQGEGTVSWPDDVRYSDCRPTVTSDRKLALGSYFPEIPSGQTRKLVDDLNQPSRTPGTCEGETGGLSSICCFGNEAGSETISWEYWEYDALPDWDGDWTSDGVGRKVSLVQFYNTASGAFQNGITSLVLARAYYEFPIKWGDCWTEQNQRTETFDGSTDVVTGPDKIYPFRSMDSVGDPYFDQIDGTADTDPYSLMLDMHIDANVISKSNITITAQAYATQWQKH